MRVSVIKTSHSPLSYLLLTVSKTLAALFASYCDSPSKFVWISCVTAIAGRPKPAICLLPERLRWKLLPKQRYVDPHGRGMLTQFFDWEADTLPLNCRRPRKSFLEINFPLTPSTVDCFDSHYLKLHIAFCAVCLWASSSQACNAQTYGKLLQLRKLNCFAINISLNVRMKFWNSLNNSP